MTRRPLGTYQGALARLGTYQQGSWSPSRGECVTSVASGNTSPWPVVIWRRGTTWHSGARCSSPPYACKFWVADAAASH
jgi:hypothetical protein